jgi:hypothetical protein
MNQENTTCTFKQIKTLHREGIEFEGAKLMWLVVYALDQSDILRQ